MVDIALRDALTALKNKIIVVTAAEWVMAEDLALLATAIERIAGRISLDEFEVITEAKVAAMDQQLADATTTLGETHADFTAEIDTIFADKTVDLATTVRDVSLQSVLTPVIAANAIDRDAFGRITRYDQGNGVILTNIRYERERVLGWRETCTKPDSTTVAYDYFVNSNLVTGEIISLTRTAV